MLSKRRRRRLRGKARAKPFDIYAQFAHLFGDTHVGQFSPTGRSLTKHPDPLTRALAFSDAYGVRGKLGGVMAVYPRPDFEMLMGGDLMQHEFKADVYRDAEGRIAAQLTKTSQELADRMLKSLQLAAYRGSSLPPSKDDDNG
jgi:hypothetical protein